MMTRQQLSPEMVSLDEERVELRVKLMFLREQGGDAKAIATGQKRLNELNKFIGERIKRGW